MALSASQVTALTDSIAKGISDYNANVVTGLSASFTAMNAGISGTGASATIGRVLGYAGVPDLADELTLLPKAYAMGNQTAAFLSGLQNMNGWYQQYFPILDALDTAQAGLNQFLLAQTIQVNGWFAAAFNYYVGMASLMGLRSVANLPTALSAGTFFPYASVDNMWGFTSSGATTFTANAVGANVNTAGSGGGAAQLLIYKANAGNAAGGATFNVSYINGAGQTVTASYTTTSGVPVGAGSLAAGYVIPGAIGSQVTGVTGVGMTAGEQYIIGTKLVRTPAY